MGPFRAHAIHHSLLRPLQLSPPQSHDKDIEIMAFISQSSVDAEWLLERQAGEWCLRLVSRGISGSDMLERRSVSKMTWKRSNLPCVGFQQRPQAPWDSHLVQLVVREVAGETLEFRGIWVAIISTRR